jgi:hypothetical protein
VVESASGASSRLLTSAAQDRFRELVRDHLGPSLRSMGFSGRGQEFVLPDARSWILLGIQRSRWNDRRDCEFTIQLTVVDKTVWEELRTRHGYGERPYSTRWYGPRLWQTRLGDLLADGRDVWWHVHPDSDVEPLGRELMAAIERYALPAIRDHVASESR